MTLFPQFLRTDAQLISEMSVEQVTARAIKLLQLYEPSDGYYLAFSGGKDSCVCDELLKMSGVAYKKHYNNVTIDPPELVRFIKDKHPDAIWENSQRGNMFHRIATRPGLPPTRAVRWCCDEYKEGGGKGRTKVLGVRAAESKKRAIRWRETTRDMNKDAVVCPIVYWTDDQVWAFIRHFNVPYCSLYDEGWNRLGCVGCPLAFGAHQDREFVRWPRYEALWKKAVIANWERFKDTVNTKTGKPRFHSKFKTGEDFWKWWRHKQPVPHDEDCQSKILWTNE